MHEPKYRNILNLSIAELELAVRSHSALRNIGIETIADLVRKSEEELLKLKGFRKKYLAEINDILEVMGLTLGLNLNEDISSQVARLQALREQSKPLYARRTYPEPETPLDAEEWNKALETEHGEKIVEFLEPFQKQPLDLMPPIESLKEKITDALLYIKFYPYPIWIVSASERKKEDQVFRQAYKIWDQSDRSDPPPLRNYDLIGGRFLSQKRYSELTWWNFPTPLSRIVDSSAGLRPKNTQSLEWHPFLTKIHYLLKEKTKVWHMLERSFRNYQGAGSPIQVKTIRKMVMDMVDCRIGLTADGQFESTPVVDNFTKLVLCGNIPFGRVTRYSPDPMSPYSGGNFKDQVFLVFVA